MKLGMMPATGKSLFANLATFVLAALICLGVGCGPSSLGTGGQGALGLVPDSVVNVHVFDVGEVLKDEEFLESQIGRNFDQMEETFDEQWGIILEDINTLVLIPGDLTILEGLDGMIDFGLIEDTLDDRNFDKDDYRGYTLWEGSGQDLAILEDDGYVIIGDSGKLKRILRLIDQDEGFLLQDDENPLTRALDRVGTGLLVQGHKSCDSLKLEVRRCEAWAAVLSTSSELYNLESTLVILFGSERSTERHVDDFEDHLEKVQESVDSLEYEVVSDGEFIEVKASVDRDDLGNCDFLEAIHGSECLVTAKVEPAAPRFTPEVQRPLETVPVETVVEVETLVEEKPGIMPVSSMARNTGKVLTVQGRVVDSIFPPGRRSGFVLEIEDIRDVSITNWILMQSAKRLASRYLGKTVCVRGTVQPAIDLLIDFGILEGYAIEVMGSSQIRTC